MQLNVACKFVKDMLKGDEITELRMELKGVIGHEMGDEYKEEWVASYISRWHYVLVLAEHRKHHEEDSVWKYICSGSCYLKITYKKLRWVSVNVVSKSKFDTKCKYL